MARPRKRTYSLAEALDKLAKAGINAPPPKDEEADPCAPLSERIPQLLGIIKSKPVKATDMTGLVMYDITSNKVRQQISKYLLKQGCIRIQKSVFLFRLPPDRFREINEALQEINDYYDNQDSIILVPINVSDVRSMKLIGHNVNIQTITDKPNTLFF